MNRNNNATGNAGNGKTPPGKTKFTLGGLAGVLIAVLVTLFSTTDDNTPTTTNATTASASATSGSSAATSKAGTTTGTTTGASATTANNQTNQRHTPQPTTSAINGIATCPINTLPDEALQQIEDIYADAEPDDGYHDGKHFGNYERLLPQERSSYYREYTVETPGLHHRGERRLVVGGGTDTNPEVWYYTDDHFESFCEIPDA